MIGVIGYIEAGRNGAVNATPALTIPTLERPQMASEESSTKACPKCGDNKPRSAFQKMSRAKDWLQTYCRDCSKAYTKANSSRISARGKAWREANAPDIKTRRAKRYIANRSVVRAKHKEYYGQNRERVIAKSAEYRRANAPAVAEGQRVYRERNADSIRETQRIYRQNNAERKRRNDRAYGAANAEKRRQRVRDWQTNNPDRYRIQHALGSATRRARVLNARVGPRKPYRDFLKWARTAPSIQCYWCKAKTKGHHRHVDHIIPLAKGGADAVENLCIACAHCNRSKCALMPEEFAGQAELKLA
jgi:5-methylcytosine-specific restriction endonuclease McrA